MSLDNGARLNHYTVVSLIGAGGMGEVYRATDTRLQRDVALKLLPARMSVDAARLERFQREARAVAALNHPNIVTIHSVEESNGVHFLTMELVEGRTLDAVLDGKGLTVGPVPGCGRAPCRRRRSGTCVGDHPPRSEASQRDVRPRRPAQGARLRPCEVRRSWKRFERGNTPT